METTAPARFYLPVGGARPWWSDELYRVLGMSPGDVPPTLDALMRHVAADERDSLTTAVAACSSGGQPFARMHTIKDLLGAHRVVLIAGLAVEPSEDDAHDVDALLVDVSAEVGTRAARTANEQLPRLLKGRAAVEQAVAVLGLLYAVDRSTAMELLRWAAQQRQLDVQGAAAVVIETVMRSEGAAELDADSFERAMVVVPPRHPGVRSAADEVTRERGSSRG